MNYCTARECMVQSTVRVVECTIHMSSLLQNSKHIAEKQTAKHKYGSNSKDHFFGNIFMSAPYTALVQCGIVMDWCPLQIDQDGFGSSNLLSVFFRP